MDINDTKELFKKKYAGLGMELVDEHEEELFFRIGKRQTVKASAGELRSYSDFESRRSNYEAAPNECSMCSINYNEQIVSFTNRGGQFLFGKRNNNKTYCEISTASEDFMNFFRFHDEFLDFCRERIQRRVRFLRRQENADLSEVLFSPTTIKVFNIGSKDIDAAINESTRRIDGCLFTLSYLKNITLKVEADWPRYQPRVRPFVFGEDVEGNELPIVDGYLVEDIVRFYQRGMASEDPVNQFLSFYQTLEYFFLSVSDEHLYRKLSNRLKDPRFYPTPKHLDRLIQDTLEHKRETDETEMLKFVLQKYILVQDAIDFIQSYERHIGSDWFTKKRKLFGEETQIVLNAGHIIGNISKRVKAVRNALVHSSDRHKRQQMFVPTAENEELVRNEIPLVKFLAERVIISSMKP